MAVPREGLELRLLEVAAADVVDGHAVRGVPWLSGPDVHSPWGGVAGAGAMQDAVERRRACRIAHAPHEFAGRDGEVNSQTEAKNSQAEAVNSQSETVR
eukprot:310658-Prorocentrum_minimum.AAC.1